MKEEECDYCSEANGRCPKCHGFTWGLPYGHSCSCEPHTAALMAMTPEDKDNG